MMEKYNTVQREFSRLESWGDNMSDNTLSVEQKKDLGGNIDFMMRNPVLITGNATTVVFTGEGVFLGLIIWVPIDGGTFYFTDNAGDPITGLPNVTAKASTTRAGTFAVKNYALTGGLKVVTADAAGVLITAAAATTA